MIYIDQPRLRDGRMCCHMVADSLNELHDYALSLGLLRRYFQKPKKHPHYDLWGFPMERVLLSLKISGSGVMVVDNKQLVLISHSLIKKTNIYAASKEGGQQESSLQENSQ